jgi:tRNA/rRNA methyltransferase
VVPKGFSLTLVEPQYPVNLGHVARLTKNFGIKKLYLVHPKVDMSVASIYASHATDVLENAEVLSFQQVRERNELLIATTAVRAQKKSNVIRRSVRPEQIGRYVRSAGSASLVLGRDTTGLTNEEIKMCDMTTVIDTGSLYRTLNISHAAAILLYILSTERVESYKAPSRRTREIFAESLNGLAAASRMPHHKMRNMLEVGRRMAVTSQLSDRQLLFMSGVFRKAVGTIEEIQGRTSKT